MIAEKFPVLFFQAAEVEVGENVAEENQPAKSIFLQHAGGLTGAAAVRAQVHIGKDQRVVDGRIHALFLVH